MNAAQCAHHTRYCFIYCFVLVPSSTPTSFFFFFNDTATTEIYTLSLHDALPISSTSASCSAPGRLRRSTSTASTRPWRRSEEHTSELQSRLHLVCRLLLEKKKKKKTTRTVRASSN